MSVEAELLKALYSFVQREVETAKDVLTDDMRKRIIRTSAKYWQMAMGLLTERGASHLFDDAYNNYVLFAKNAQQACVFARKSKVDMD